MKEVGLI